MTTISAKMICDSINTNGDRLSTLQLRYPRFIHAEFMTHRVFSRNASSSRAIPVERLIADIRADPAMPMHWGKNQKGMQADGENETPVYFGPLGVSRYEAWLDHCLSSCHVAEKFAEAGYHKQIVNRLLEPFSHINVVVSSTEWENFLRLRNHPDAQPEMQVLAQEIQAELGTSEPMELQDGEWHLPYVERSLNSGRGDRLQYWMHNDNTGENVIIDTLDATQISVACCASVSYQTVDGKPMTWNRATALYEKLRNASPPHLSPFEHQAQAAPVGNKPLWGNFEGWAQYRKEVEQWQS